MASTDEHSRSRKSATTEAVPAAFVAGVGQQAFASAIILRVFRFRIEVSRIWNKLERPLFAAKMHQALRQNSGA